MIVVLKAGRGPEKVLARLEEYRLHGSATRLDGRWVVTVEGAEPPELSERLRALSDVAAIHTEEPDYRHVARSERAVRSTVDVEGVIFGGVDIAVVAGPCTVESEAQIFAAAQAVAESGATGLRGGAYKPSTSPYGHQGLGLPALEWLHAAGRRYGLAVVTEVMDPAKVELVCEHADMLQIGARSMQNFDLLKAVGRSPKPILLKRGMSATIAEWLLAAEYIADAGNERIVLCERGIRSFDTSTRNVLDLAAVAAVRELTHLPVVVDPSHGTGRRDLVGPMAKAAIAAGADGLLIEVHPVPDQAVKDGAQSLSTTAFPALMPELARVAEAVGRRLPLRATVGT